MSAPVVYNVLKLQHRNRNYNLKCNTYHNNRPAVAFVSAIEIRCDIRTRSLTHVSSKFILFLVVLCLFYTPLPAVRTMYRLGLRLLGPLSPKYKL